MLYGWQSKDITSLNPNLFVIISSPNDDIQVRGMIVSKSITQSNNYANKFEGTDADSKSPTIAGILQSGVWSNDLQFLKKFEGKTLMTKAQTVQIFTGLEPIDLSLEIEFIAQRDTFLEVENAVSQLEYWKSPLLKDNSIQTIKEVYRKISEIDSLDTARDAANKSFDTLISGGGNLGRYKDIFGDIPNEVNVSFMKQRYNTTFVIENITIDEDKIRVHKNGGRVRQKVSLSLKSRTGITKHDLL